MELGEPVRARKVVRDRKRYSDDVTPLKAVRHAILNPLRLRSVFNPHSRPIRVSLERLRLAISFHYPWVQMFRCGHALLRGSSTYEHRRLHSKLGPESLILARQIRPARKPCGVEVRQCGHMVVQRLQTLRKHRWHRPRLDNTHPLPLIQTIVGVCIKHIRVKTLCIRSSLSADFILLSGRLPKQTKTYTFLASTPSGTSLPVGTKFPVS